MAFIEAQGLTRKYNSSVFALNDVTFSVEKGEWLAVMGPSGSGKSTLLNVLGCLDAPSAGNARVEGIDLAQLRGDALARFRAEKIGFVFQQFHLVPYLTAVENVMLAQYFHSLADEQEAADALRRVGLGDRLQHLPSELSGGEQQRVCVARALINQPNLILADEPTGNLDEVNETIVMGLFTELHREGHTILMVTHDPEIGRMAERRIELHHGRLTDVSVFPAGEEELIDNLLKAVWHAYEDFPGDPIVADKFPEFIRNRATFQLMAQEELVRNESGMLAMSPRGEGRARSVIRRHRLAERLFFNTFGLDETLLDANACRIEHTLGAEVVEKLCIFLNHPDTCPHGSPIPRGACCPAK
ncbi:MAG: ATP-binding cassette domain-containing protein [Acidobacteria bacterium]|nr:ATP-binding cassette domain-containing protein [Acidobacteriota bacterium]